MPTKKLPPPMPAPEPEEPPKRRVPISDPLVAGNTFLRLIGGILQNGAKHAGHPQVNFKFEAHSFLLKEMEQAYVRQDESAWLTVLERYLKEATAHLSQTMKPEDIPVLMEHVKALLHHPQMGGLETIGQYLLVLGHAPQDRF